MNLKLSFSYSRSCVWAVVVVFCYDILINIVGIPVTLLIGDNSFDTMLVLGVTTLILIFAIGQKGRRLRYVFPLFVLLCVIFLLTRFLYPSNYSYMSADLSSILIAFLGYVIIRMVYDRKTVMEALYHTGYLSFIYAVLIVLVKIGVFNIPSANVSYMQFGYFVLPGAIILHNKYNSEGKKIDIVLSVASALIILVFGSRGALVSFFLYLILYYIFIEKSSAKKMIIICTGAILVLLVFSNSYVQSFLINITSRVFHYDSRSLILLIEGSSLNDSGRSVMSESAISLIKEHWLLGMGPYADRANIYFNTGDIVSTGYGHYTHNIFLEMCLSFGIPITLVVCGLFMKSVVFILNNADDVERKLLLIITFLTSSRS